jgi:hypothetical protein
LFACRLGLHADYYKVIKRTEFRNGLENKIHIMESSVRIPKKVSRFFGIVSECLKEFRSGYHWWAPPNLGLSGPRGWRPSLMSLAHQPS